VKGDAVVECVPNVSEGRDARILDVLSSSLSDVRLLDRSHDPDHHRAVFTFAGHPEAVLAAAVSLAEAAIKNIRMAAHEGVHPRIGALDVLPFVPISGVSLQECAALAHRAAQILWQRFGLPSFFYEAAGTRPLEQVRRLARAGAKPDIGAGRHPTAGAVAIGARNFLIAWNIWLDSNNLALAQRIARAVRQSNGGFAGVKALGLTLPSRNRVQVSLNTVDFETTPLSRVFRAVETSASEAGVRVLGCELIGLMPERAVEASAEHQLPWLAWNDDMILERRYSIREC